MDFVTDFEPVTYSDTNLTLAALLIAIQRYSTG